MKDTDNGPMLLDDGGDDVGDVLLRQQQQPFLLLKLKKSLCPMTHENLVVKMSLKKSLKTFQ